MSLLKGLNVRGRVFYNEPLCRHTTFGIGGPVEVFAQPQDLDDLKTILEFSRMERLPVFLIGGGSNLLVSDEGLRIIVVSLKAGFDWFNVDKDKISCGGGCNLQQFILKTLECGYPGLEFMAGIPGTVGGAINMNAGADLSGPWISSFITRIKTLDNRGEVSYLERDELMFGYRESNLRDLAILEAEFSLGGPKEKKLLFEEYERLLEDKKNRQELSMPSAGCIFKNPGSPNLSAARLIEECGFKGKRIGDAMVSAKHANFIVNLGRAVFKDVINLIDIIRYKVLQEYNITLKTEVEILE